MKKLYASVSIFLCCTFSSFAQSAPSLHSYTAETIDHNVISFSQYSGKKLLLVNTASFCMYTPQYAALQQLYDSYKQHNFEIIGFPCNDFGLQDPYSDSIIDIFCTSNYSVTFQMMSKVSITAPDTTPIYRWLQRAGRNGVQTVSVDWNFNKFLIDECGHWVAHRGSPVSPLDTSITNWILSSACVVNTTGLIEQNHSGLIQFTSANPVSSSLNFTVKNNPAADHIDVFTINGCFVDRIFISKDLAGQKISYDLSHLSNGVYFLSLNDRMKQQNTKFVVLK